VRPGPVYQIGLVWQPAPIPFCERLKVGPSAAIRGARAVGVDDWASHKEQRYGTILVDLETHTAIDLLPDRSADSLAAWFQLHPGAEVVSRDRAASMPTARIVEPRKRSKWQIVFICSVI